jgi:hypothetical protein
MRRRARRSAQPLGDMRIGALRWVAVPLSSVASYFLAFFLFLDIALSCLHLGARPEGLCSDWWYDNHAWVAAVAFGLAIFFGSVLLPVVLAPRFKGAIGAVALVVVIIHTIVEFDLWVWSVAVPTVALLAVVLGFTAYFRSLRSQHVA